MKRVGIVESSVPLNSALNSLPKSQIYVLDLPPGMTGVDKFETEMLENIRLTRGRVQELESDLNEANNQIAQANQGLLDMQEEMDQKEQELENQQTNEN